MESTDVPNVTDGPVISLINKRLRALKKKHNRIIQMEESMAQGRTLNKEQEEVLRSKPALVVLIDELEKLRDPLSSAVSEEINLALQRNQVSPDQPVEVPEQIDDSTPEGKDDGSKVEDLVNLLYFGSLFDVKSQNDFTSIMLTRTHERGCCLTYDYVSDDAMDLLGEKDLDLISRLSGLMVSRPVDSSLSHRNALQRCIDHAKLWLSNSDQPIDPNAGASYSGLRDKLKKIMTSDYFTTTPEMKAPVEVAAAAGNYASFHVPPVAPGASVQGEGSADYYPRNEEDESIVQEQEAVYHESGPEEEDKDEQEIHDPVDDQQEQVHQQQQAEPNDRRDFDHREQQYAPRRSYQNPRGGRGSGRRGFPNGRGGRGGGGGGGGRSRGGYQNGRYQYYDQAGGSDAHYQRSYNNRGRGGRGGGGGQYNQHGSGVRNSSEYAEAAY